MNFTNKFSIAVIWNYLNKTTGYLLDFILSVVLARGLGEYYYGVYTELWNFVFLFSLFSSAGIDTAITVFLPKLTENAHHISCYLRMTFKFFGVVVLVIMLLLMLTGGYLSRTVHSPELSALLKIVAFYIAFYSFILIAQAILLSFYETRFLFWVNTILKSSVILCSYLILKNGGSLEYVIWSMIGINMITAGVYLFRIYPLFRVKPEVQSLSPFFKFGFIAWITSFINYLLGRYFDIFLLGVFSIPKANIGYYNIAFSLTLAMAAIITSGFSGITTAAFAQFEHQNKRQVIAEGWLKVTKLCIFISIPLFLFVILNSRILISAVYGEAYVQSANLLQLFAFLYLISLGLGSGTNSALLYSINKEKIVLKIRAVCGLVNVLLDIILIPIWGVKGAILASGSAIVLTIGAEFLFSRKNANLKFPARFVFKISLAAVISLVVSRLLPAQGLLELLVTLVIYIIFFILCLFLLKPFVKDEVISLSNLDVRAGRLLNFFSEE